jgi:hypothetical protein
VFGACFAFVWAAFRIFWRVQVAKVLVLVVFLHVVVYWHALPVGGFEFTMFGALFCNLDFAVVLR